jgi:hypothetical protein
MTVIVPTAMHSTPAMLMPADTMLLMSRRASSREESALRRGPGRAPLVGLPAPYVATWSQVVQGEEDEVEEGGGVRGRQLCSLPLALPQSRVEDGEWKSKRNARKEGFAAMLTYFTDGMMNQNASEPS